MIFLIKLNPHPLYVSGKIPPESTLIFNIDLLEIRNGPRSHESFQEMDLNDDWKLSKNEVTFPFSLSLFPFSSLLPFFFPSFLLTHFLRNIFLNKIYFIV